jgi:hypothetical protein
MRDILSPPTAFPSEFREDTEFLREAMREYNARLQPPPQSRRAKPRWYGFYELEPSEQSKVIQRAQELKQGAR